MRTLDVIEIVHLDRDHLLERLPAVERDHRGHQLRDRRDRRDVVGAFGVDRTVFRGVEHEDVRRLELELGGVEDRRTLAGSRQRGGGADYPYQTKEKPIVHQCWP